MDKRPSSRVLLISMPWCNSHMPALGLSLLKASLARRAIPCDIQYFNLLWREMVEQHMPSLSRKIERKGSLSTEELLFLQGRPGIFTGDWVFSQYFFGPGSLDAEGFAPSLLQAWRGPYYESLCREFLELPRLVPGFLSVCLDRVRARDYSLVGFGSMFDQQLASLSLARLIKQSSPDVGIVFGGANCTGEMGETLLETFDFIDYVFTSDADETFPRFVESFFPDSRQGTSRTWHTARKAVAS